MNRIFLLAIKIMGLYVLFRFVESLVGLVAFFPGGLFSGGFSQSELSMLLTAGFGFILYSLGAFYLIRRAHAIADIICPEEATSEVKGALDRDTLTQIAFMAVGVFVVSNALSSIIPVVETVLHSERYGNRSPWTGWPGLFGVCVRLAIGLYLVLGSAGLLRAINNLRRA